MRKLLLYLLAFSLYPLPSFAQDYCMPVDFDIALAGNYGELRPNHFHAGIDIKTQQTIGHPVRSFSDGYVERVGINAYGYGLVLYVTHPAMQRMTVYAHLNDFSEKIWEKVRERQVKEELNNADITFAPDEIPVKMGEVIAMSGNTGSSGGPHVHFEVRGLMSAPGADDEYWYDPMPYFIDKIADTTPPKISNLYLYTNPNTLYSKRRQIYNRTANAWGKVGFAIKAYDYMDGQYNRFGVKRVKLYCDDKLIFNWNQLFHQYHEYRMVSSIIDSLEWATRRSMIMKSFVREDNKLQMIDHTLGDGVVEINEERPYNFRYELEDAHGNKSTLAFTINGTPSAASRIPSDEEMTRLIEAEVRVQHKKQAYQDSIKNVAAADVTAPIISIIGKVSTSKIMLSISDKGSGVKNWKVYIDSQFVPFDMNNRGTIVGRPSLYGIKPGKHTIEIFAYDKAGNEKKIVRNF